MKQPPRDPGPARSLPVWAAPLVFALLALAIVLLGLLGMSILERRWEAERPPLVVRPIARWEPDNAVWGENYPREYESYSRTARSDTRTRFGGADPRDYLEEDPNLVLLWAGYGFSQDYKQGRGHYHAVEDIRRTARVKRPVNAGTCWTCKSTDVPRLMDAMGPAAFYAANFHDLAPEIRHPIGCQDCHDPQTLRLRVTRPALREAWAARGLDIDQATHQEMRSLVCAQCHAEYYFQPEPADYLKFPWDRGLTAEAMLAYYEEIGFSDFTHALSGTPIVKAQHPDYELWSTGVHAYRGVACADCHMPYRSEGGLKFTDHHVQSPLLDISTSCGVCHRWSEDEIRTRVESIQQKTYEARLRAEEALVRAHLDIAAAARAGAAPEAQAEARGLVRRAQFRWDYVAASNGMGFHSPQESVRIYGQAADEAQQARLALLRPATAYPDLSSRARAAAVSEELTQSAAPAAPETMTR